MKPQEQWDDPATMAVTTYPSAIDRGPLYVKLYKIGFLICFIILVGCLVSCAKPECRYGELAHYSEFSRGLTLECVKP